MQIIPNGKNQFWYPNGSPLANGTVGFYQPNTLIPVTTYQDSAGSTPNTNPITLDGNGQAVIYGLGTFRQILKDIAGNTIWDQVVHAQSDTATEWTLITSTPTYISATQFSLPGDQTATFTAQRRALVTVTAGTIAGTIKSSAYTLSNTVITVDWDSTLLDSGLSTVWISFLSSVNSAVPAPMPATIQMALSYANSPLTNLLSYFRNTTVNFVSGCGGVGNGATNNDAAIALAIVAGNVGAKIQIPPGTYMCSDMALTFTTNNHNWEGSGQFNTFFKCSTAPVAGKAFVNFVSCARISMKDIQFDANSKCDYVRKFTAPIGTACGTMRFTSIYMTGALVNTDYVAASGGGSQDDISHILNDSCSWRSNCSNAQYKCDAANAVSNTIIGGAGLMGSPSVTPLYNIDISAGQITCFSVFFSGSSTDSIHVTGGQVIIIGGRSEDDGTFFNSTTADNAGYVQAPHVITGGFQSSNAGSDSIIMNGTRRLVLDGMFLNGNVQIGTAGKVDRRNVIFAAAKDFVITGNGQLRSNFGDNNKSQSDSTLPTGSAANTPYHYFYNETVSSNLWAICQGTSVNDLVFRNLSAAAGAGQDGLQLLSGTNQGVAIGAGLLALNAVDGFAFIPTCNGTPTGVPNPLPTGFVPMVYDKDTDKLWMYRSGWKSAQFA